MTLTIHWWWIVVILVLIPLGYSYVRTPGGDWDLQIDTMFVVAVCWTAAIVLTISRFVWA